MTVVRRWVRPRPRNAHKGSSGRVLIIAGSRGMAGAGILCAMGAVRAGAGLVRLGIVESQQVVAAKRAPLEVTTQALPEDGQGRISSRAGAAIKKTISNFKPHVIAVGPGLGVTPAVKKIVQELVYRARLPVVLDADGLNVLAKSKVSRKFFAPVVMTPHAGELARLLHSKPGLINQAHEKMALLAARTYGGVCLLKGSGTVITDGQMVWKNTTGNPAMASGGMGDVLTGIIAALWAERLAGNLSAKNSGLVAAALGAFLHGLAGDLAVKKFPERSLLASDLAESLPNAFQKI